MELQSIMNLKWSHRCGFRINASQPVKHPKNCNHKRFEPCGVHVVSGLRCAVGPKSCNENYMDHILSKLRDTCNKALCINVGSLVFTPTPLSPHAGFLRGRQELCVLLDLFSPSMYLAAKSSEY